MTGILLLSQSVVILLFAFAATASMRRRSAAERHAMWLAAFVVVLLLPLLKLLPPITTPLSDAVAVRVVASGALTQSATSKDWLPVLWGLGAMLCFGRLLVGAIGAFLLVRSASHIGDLRPYRILYSPTLSGPVAWGIGRKLMLLPAAAMEWDEDRRAVVVSHEAAHLKRNDCWALLIAEITCALFWCNPLVWLAASQLRREQEHAADDEVLNSGADPVSYAGHLVALARAGRPPILTVGAVSRSQLTARVEAILDPRRVRCMLSRRIVMATTMALFVVALPLASMQAERKVERIGGDVLPPRPIEKQEPNYTEEAREAKIEGTVTLGVIIEEDGTTSDVKVKRGLDPGLDANAVLAVLQWKFEPAQKNGKPVAVSANIEVNFRLL